MKSQKLLLTIVSTILAVLGNRAVGQTVFDENFSTYSNSTELRSAWTLLGGDTVNYWFLGVDTGITSDNRYGVLNNGLISRQLSQTVTSDWTLAFEGMINAPSRSAWVGLFDATGTHGYTIYMETNTNDNGRISIRKFDLSSPLTDWTQQGTVIAGQSQFGAVSPDAIGTLPLTSITLNYISESATLQVYVDGTKLVEVTDSSFSSFSQIFIKGGTGNSGFYIDNITVTTIPEPTSAGCVMGVVLIACLAFRRRFHRA
jgi:hypothetical protein